MNQMKLSVGVSDFEKIRSDGYYYIDKSGWIKGLLESGAEVTLLTRPRRFGKTLGMSMLANFFDITKESGHLFKGLEIMEVQKAIFHRLKMQTASLVDIQSALLVIMRMMQAYYGKKVILLLDEYDVPIAKASSKGYYTEMMEVLKTMLSTSLKDNSALELAVVTGCLKIAKESGSDFVGCGCCFACTTGESMV